MFHTLILSLALLAQADPAPPLPAIALIESAISDAIEKAEPYVVAISRYKSSDGNTERTTAVRGEQDQPVALQLEGFDGVRLGGGEEVSFDYASGVVIGPNQAILTTFHAVRGASRIKVRAAGKVSFEAEIIAADPRSDLAVLAPRKIAGVPPPDLKSMKIGDSSKLRKGAFLIALGNPYNAARDGTASAAWGILSNTQRRIESLGDEPTARLLQNFPTLLQLDTKLNVGMSGGAVINLKGELVGLTTASANVAGFDVQAGYAIPMDTLTRRVIDRLREGREAEYGFLGISLDQMGRNIVSQAHPNGPAAQGGVVQGDAILMVGDQPVNDSESLVLAVNAQPVGKPVVLQIKRGDRIIKAELVLAKYPVAGGISTNRATPWRGMRIDYTSTLTGAFGQPAVEAMAKGGVAVVDVVRGSPADMANIKRGLIISRVGDKSTRTPEQFAKAVEGLTGPVNIMTEQGELIIEAAPSKPR